MEIINKYLSGVLVPVALLLCSIFFLIKLVGLPLRKPISIIRGIVFSRGNKNSSIRALIMALAGTLGVGNIVGVASAIALGGAGAVFWMWISAILAMILKYGEVVLALLHKRIGKSGSYGGAMYYMMDFFVSCKKSKLGWIITLIFIVFCLMNGFSMGCVVQVNAISESIGSIADISPLIVGALLGFLGVWVFFFNGKRIFKICERLIPFVSVLYLGMSALVISLSYKRIPDVINEILTDAFSFVSVGGGVFGFFTSRALRYGTIRGLFSNEAGCGTSPIAHATSGAKSCVEQGFLGIAEVFIDTIIVCSATAFVILLNWDVACAHLQNPIMMVMAAFERSLGQNSNILLCASVFLFAFATIVCWGYYGRECVRFLISSELAQKLYYGVYILFIFAGAFISMDMVWQIADLSIGVMTLINLTVLALMSREIKRETKKYYKKELP